MIWLTCTRCGASYAALRRTELSPCCHHPAVERKARRWKGRRINHERH